MDVLAPKNGVVQDLIPLIQKKVDLAEEDASTLRLFETHQCRISKELDPKTAIVSIPDYAVLYAELIPEEERAASDEDRAMYAFHFDKEPAKTHGVPFKFVIKPVSICPGRPGSLRRISHAYRANCSGIPESVFPSGRASKGSNSTS